MVANRAMAAASLAGFNDGGLHILAVLFVWRVVFFVRLEGAFRSSVNRAARGGSVELSIETTSSYRSHIPAGDGRFYATVTALKLKPAVSSRRLTRAPRMRNA